MWQVIGHERIVQALARSLREGHMAHAYLFVGPEHVGKMTLAVNLAQALNCGAQEKAPCGECSVCRRIASGKHPDVMVIRLSGPVDGDSPAGAKMIGVDQIREMERIIGFKAYEGPYRVVIIEGADRMSEGAANSLLKTLEEPPPDTVLILLAVDESALLSTITSRCRKFELRTLPPPEIERALIERYGAPPERARLLSHLCRGCIGWAIEAVRDETVLEEYGTRIEDLLSASGSDLTRRFKLAAALAERFGRDRETVRRQLDLWLDWWRDVMLMKGGCPESIANIDREETLRRYAGCLSFAEIGAAIKSIQAALRELEGNANPRLALDVLMLALPSIPDESEKIHA